MYTKRSPSYDQIRTPPRPRSNARHGSPLDEAGSPSFNETWSLAEAEAAEWMPMLIKEMFTGGEGGRAGHFVCDESWEIQFCRFREF